MISVSSSHEGAAHMLTGKHVLVCLLTFFGIVFGVNFYFMFAALSTHTGVVSVEPYRKGLAYNSRIAADEAQQARGWHDVLSIDAAGAVLLKIVDKSNIAVPDLIVTTTIGRPSTIQFDRHLTLKPQSNGVYVSSAGSLDAGAWLVSIEARTAENASEPVYRARRRLWLKY
ncbi:MAG: FixH family protein [Hyphomicrobiaceae bacterium]|nr:FixH family protein [Hyphomicrobiaceae bacterium]